MKVDSIKCFWNKSNVLNFFDSKAVPAPAHERAPKTAIKLVENKRKVIETNATIETPWKIFQIFVRKIIFLNNYFACDNFMALKIHIESQRRTRPTRDFVRTPRTLWSKYFKYSFWEIVLIFGKQLEFKGNFSHNRFVQSGLKTLKKFKNSPTKSFKRLSEFNHSLHRKIQRFFVLP